MSDAPAGGVVPSDDLTNLPDAANAGNAGDASRGAGAVSVYEHFTVTQHAGPLPPPDVLREYEAVAPGYGERLLTEMERNGEHRRKMDRDALALHRAVGKDRADYARRGQLYATAVGLGSLTAATLLGVFGETGGQVVAGIVGAGGLGSLVWAFTRYPTTRAAGDSPAPPPDATDAADLTRGA